MRRFFRDWHAGALRWDLGARAQRFDMRPAPPTADRFLVPCSRDGAQQIEVNAPTGRWRDEPDVPAGALLALLGRLEGVAPLQVALDLTGLGSLPEMSPPPTLPALEPDHPALKARGLDSTVCQARGIGQVIDHNHPHAGWLGVTVFDILGRPVGMNYRRVDAGPTRHRRRSRRWSLGRSFPRGRHLYNLDRAWPSLASSATAILVEGPFDALHLQRHGWPNTVALLGNRLTGWHVEALLMVGVARVVLLFDNDHGGREALRWALRDDGRLDQFEVVTPRVLPPGHDPDQLPPRELAAALDGFRPIPASQDRAAARP